MVSARDRARGSTRLRDRLDGPADDGAAGRVRARQVLADQRPGRAPRCWPPGRSATTAAAGTPRCGASWCRCPAAERSIDTPGPARRRPDRRRGRARPHLRRRRGARGAVPVPRLRPRRASRAARWPAALARRRRCALRRFESWQHLQRELRVGRLAQRRAAPRRAGQGVQRRRDAGAPAVTREPSDAPGGDEQAARSVREETDDDRDAVRRVVAAAFGGERVPSCSTRCASRWPGWTCRSSPRRRTRSSVTSRYTRGWLDSPDQAGRGAGAQPARRCGPTGSGPASARCWSRRRCSCSRTGPSRWSSSRATPASTRGSASSAGDELRLHRRRPRGSPAPAFQVATLPGYEQTWMTGALVYPDVWWRHDAVGLRPEA